MNGTNYISIAEAARLLETSELQVMLKLNNNELQGKMFDDTWHVDRSSLDLCDKPGTAEIVIEQGCGICGTKCGSGC